MIGKMKFRLLIFLFSLGLTMPPPPNHSFVKKVISSKKSVTNDSVETSNKKVFVHLVQGQYTFKKRREKAGRVTFSCNGCEKLHHYLPVMAWRERVDINDPEHDNYILDLETLPSQDEHLCGTSGLEEMVRNFRKDLEEGARQDPTQAFPALYQSVRYESVKVN